MMKRNHLRDGLGLIESCLADAEERWGPAIYARGTLMVSYDREVRAFPQTWGSTAVGFAGSGFSGAAMTKATTVVVTDPHQSRHGVYVAGRHAYDVRMDHEAHAVFMADLERCTLRGARTAREQYPLIHQPLEDVAISWGKTRDEYGRLLVKFEPAVIFAGTWSPERTMVIHARPDLGVVMTTPWDEMAWNPEEIYERLSHAVGDAWSRHVLGHTGVVNPQIAENLRRAGTDDVRLNQTEKRRDRKKT
jgi:hypothetical protein